MTPATANYKNHVRQDTIGERIFTISKTIDEVLYPVDLTGAAIKCDFKLMKDRVSKSLGDGIVMVNASQGKFKIESFSLQSKGTWNYDVQITFPNGDVKTWVKGNIVITDDVTI